MVWGGGVVAEAWGVGVEAGRYDQRRGRMGRPGRGSGGRRYGMEDVRRLRFIRQAQAAGFSLDEIAELIALDAGRDRARARELARDKIGALDAKIAELTGARTALQRLARECAASDDGPCPIIAAFDCP